MIGENIAILRKGARLSQEALAEKLGVSRQTVAKWETNESIPDVLHCDSMSELFGINLDDLLHLDLRAGVPPKGKYVFGAVTVGEKGQIVIPVKARRVFHIQPGDTLMVLGDINQGLALVSADLFLDAARQIQEGKS